jgi:hypothetical protein
VKWWRIGFDYRAAGRGYLGAGSVWASIVPAAMLGSDQIIAAGFVQHQRADPSH